MTTDFKSITLLMASIACTFYICDGGYNFFTYFWISCHFIVLLFVVFA